MSAVTVILGPSSAGKSTYIQRILGADFRSVILAYQLEQRSLPKDHAIVHFNSMAVGQEKDLSERNIRIWEKLLSCSRQIKVVFLIESLKNLQKRCLLRTALEPVYSSSRFAGYQGLDFFDWYHQ